MSDTLSLDKKEEKVIKTIKDNEPINNSGISEITGFNHTKVHRTVTDLEDKGLIQNTEWKNNKTNWQVEENVDIEKNYRLERIFDLQIAAHLIEMVIFLSVAIYLPYSLFPYILLGFTIAFLPSFIHSINYALEEHDIHEIQITKTET